MVGELILVAYHVVVLDAVKFSFKLPDLGAICIHLLAGARLVFVKLVDDQCRIPIHHEVFDAELNGYTESVETCFIFDGVVRGRKVYPENVSELIIGRYNEQNAYTSTIDVKGTVKVHHPVLGASGSDRLLDLYPLNDEISERL